MKISKKSKSTPQSKRPSESSSHSAVDANHDRRRGPRGSGGPDRDPAEVLRAREQEENPSIEPAAEATVCACRNEVPVDTVLRSNLGTRRTYL